MVRKREEKEKGGRASTKTDADETKERAGERAEAWCAWVTVDRAAFGAVSAISAIT